MHDLRRQDGIGKKDARAPSLAIVQVTVEDPMSSKPSSQTKVAVSSTELPVNVRSPLGMSLGSGHSATESKSIISSRSVSMVAYTSYTCTFVIITRVSIAIIGERSKPPGE